ncbi:FHA domain-containing protein [Calycomorphotria hydatis]|nr:FHA domain-containing protein [Calycomorphotria hydatis]
MALVTLQVLEGLERGRTFRDYPTPITIGREEENTIRLNDERVSRFHAKLQDDGGKVILTDLESTNGTRVNGRPVQVRILRPGDQLSVGRCMLLFGGAEEIASHLSQDKKLRQPSEAPQDSDHRGTVSVQQHSESDFESWFDQPITNNDGGYAADWGKLPEGLTPLQRAQLSDLLAHVHEELRTALSSGKELSPDTEKSEMGIDWAEWQRVLKLEMELAVLLRQVVDPK